MVVKFTFDEWPDYPEAVDHALPRSIEARSRSCHCQAARYDTFAFEQMNDTHI